VYDLKDDQVTLFAKPVGSLASEEVRAALRRALAVEFPMSPTLKKAIFQIVVDESCCPGCGGQYVEKSRCSNVGMGFCVACGDALFKFKGRVAMQFHPDRPGWKRFKSLLTVEPIEPVEPAKASDPAHLMY